MGFIVIGEKKIYGYDDQVGLDTSRGRPICLEISSSAIIDGLFNSISSVQKVRPKVIQANLDQSQSQRICGEC